MDHGSALLLEAPESLPLIEAEAAPLESISVPQGGKPPRPPADAKARGLSIFCGLFVAAVGIFVIAGWYQHWSLLSRTFPGVLPMKYNTALCFVLSGIGIVLPWLGCNRVSAFLGAILVLFMGLSMAENFSGRDLGIDALFFNSYEHRDAFPNRPSPLTCCSFVLMGTALVLTGVYLNLRLRLAVIGILACSLTMIGLVALFGYTFGIESASGWGAYTRMSVYTAASFILLSAGLFLWAWSMARQTNFSFIRWLPVAGSVTLMAMISLVSAVSFVQLQNSSGWRLHTYQVLNSSQSLLQDIFDFQRGMRGYVLTGTPSHLALFHAGSQAAPKDLAQLFALTRDNARQQENLRVLSRHLSDLLAYSNGLVATRPLGPQASVRLESSGTGFAVLNATLGQLRLVQDEEQHLLALRTAKADGDFHNTSRLLIWSSVLAAVLLIVANILASYEVSRRRKTEDQLRVAMTQQTELAEKARAAERAKTEFLSNMSHELRTPLNAILGFAQLMQLDTPSSNPSQSKSLTQILRSGWYLLELINGVLDLAAVESGKLSLSKEAVALPELLSTCEEMLMPQARERSIRMSFPNFIEPIYVQADHTRLKQILLNLISNALKYNRNHGTVTVTCVSHGPGRLRIQVQDTGEGLPPEKMAQLFTPFNRLGQESGKVVGTGIGLVMSKRLAELMDGTIGAESKVSEGSTFWCELPLAQAPARAPEPVVKPSAARDILGQAGKRTLLYIEDNPANMALVEEFITRFPGMKLITAVDAMSGINLAWSSHPDIVLMDINLPGISGTRALEILRGDPATADIPVIALSANALPREISKGLATGFSSYLTKPIKLKEFEAALAAVLGEPVNALAEKSGQLAHHALAGP